MSVTIADIRSNPIDMAKCEVAEQRILDILNESDLGLGELLFVLAQTLIDVGGTLEGVNEKLSFTMMWRRYATEPTLGNALMAQGSDILREWLRLPEDDEEQERKI